MTDAKSQVRLVTYTEDEIAEAFRILAARNGRTVAAELRMALLRYLDDETVTVELEVVK